MNILILSFLTNLNFLSFFLSSPLSPYYFNTFKINQTKKFKKKKKGHDMNANFSVIFCSYLRHSGAAAATGMTTLVGILSHQAGTFEC